MSSDLVAFLLDRIAEDEWDALPFRNPAGVTKRWRCDESGGKVRQVGPTEFGLPDVISKSDTHMIAAHIARWDPARVLTECAAKRRIIAEVQSWAHTYLDGDTWFSCAQAVEPSFASEEEPGSGCADESRAGGPCDCGLERRQNLILLPLALPYAAHPGYRAEWAPTTEETK